MVGGAYGTSMGFHTLAVRFRRGAGDVHGLGSDATLGFDGAWSWTPHAQPWTLGSGITYERFEGVGSGALQAWLVQWNAVRRLSPHFELALTAVHMAHASEDLEDLGRTGLRIAVVWRPNPFPAR